MYVINSVIFLMISKGCNLHCTFMMTFKGLLFSPFSREKRNEYNGILWGFYFLTWDIEDTKSVEFASVAIC